VRGALFTPMLVVLEVVRAEVGVSRCAFGDFAIGFEFGAETAVEAEAAAASKRRALSLGLSVSMV
jgi:hypothetical protein